MMVLSKKQVANLLGLVTSVEPDQLDCDDCFGQLAEFAELHLTSQDIPEAMRAIEHHLEQCLCCKDEFNALLEALRSLDEPTPTN